MSNTWIVGDNEFSHGPDRHIGGPNCPQHHDGVRTGISDYCCCCDPCRYTRPPDRPSSLILGCCRCVPRLLCVSFSPDAGSEQCCRSVSMSLSPVFTGGNGWDQRATYSGTLNGISIAISVLKHEENGPCFWSISSSTHYFSEEVEIDHINVTCLEPPVFSVTDVSDSSGCVGTISFSTSDLIKVPFRKPSAAPSVSLFAPIDPQCDCDQVPGSLCVYGVRHRGEPAELVEFSWDEGLGDRWTYLPCNGNPTTDKEHIYLRGDEYGNCYLELDFEQTGDTTNDWAVPPNTLGEDIHEIRPGMIAIDSCGLDLFAYSEVAEVATIEYPTSRAVSISAGTCSGWKYICGSCRCVPSRVCVTGAIDGETVIAEGYWDGESGWDVQWDGYSGNFRVLLESDGCGDCVLRATGSFQATFLQSDAIECGDAMSGEMYAEYDPYNPTAFNWLWVTAAPCDCLVSPCNFCDEERCGGMPDTIYYEIQTRALFILGYEPEKFCNITIPLYYYKRFFGTSRAMICGYIGHTAVYCPPDEHNLEARTFVIRVSLRLGTFDNANYQVDKADATTSPLEFSNVFSGGVNRPSPVLASCDPLLAETPWFSMPVSCRWGCEFLPTSEQPTEMKETFVE